MRKWVVFVAEKKLSGEWFNQKKKQTKIPSSFQHQWEKKNQFNYSKVVEWSESTHLRIKNSNESKEEEEGKK